MKRLYNRGRYLERVRKFEECNGLSEEIQERNKRRNMMSREEKRKTEDSRSRIKSRSREV